MLKFELRVRARCAPSGTDLWRYADDGQDEDLQSLAEAEAVFGFDERDEERDDERAERVERAGLPRGTVRFRDPGGGADTVVIVNLTGLEVGGGCKSECNLWQR